MREYADDRASGVGMVVIWVQHSTSQLFKDGAYADGRTSGADVAAV